MSGRGSKVRPCTTAEARARLASARQFLDALDVLELSEIPMSNDVLASNAILAAIAAADAICCARRQHQSASGNHNDAAELLRQIDKRPGDDLARVLRYKNDAAYSTRQTTDRKPRPAAESLNGSSRPPNKPYKPGPAEPPVGGGYFGNAAT